MRILKVLKEQRLTSYECFFWYLKSICFDENNLVFQKMAAKHEAGKKDWSDIEAALCELEEKDHKSVKEIKKARDDVRNHFAPFLQSIASASFLNKLNSFAQEQPMVPASEPEAMETLGRSILSCTRFLADVDPAQWNKLSGLTDTKYCNHHDSWFFQFMNFNYTPLLDNYLFWDDSQFEPKRFPYSSNNIIFDANPRRIGEGRRSNFDYQWSGKGLLSIEHPHGSMDIPRSILFGVGDTNNQTIPSAYTLQKSNWAQDNKKYGEIIQKTELFIIFGMSLGASDNWWWNQIREQLGKKENARVIVYWYSHDDIDTVLEEVVNRFIASTRKTDSLEDREFLENHIVVIPFDDDTELCLFNTTEAKSSIFTWNDCWPF